MEFVSLIIISHQFVCTQDHRFVKNKTRMIISSADVFSTLWKSAQCVSWNMWTFQTLPHLRIKIIFQEFHFSELYEYFEFGDGLSGKEETRLARFSGNVVPTDVMSVSSASWAYAENSHGNLTHRLLITVTTVADSGNTSSDDVIDRSREFDTRDRHETFYDNFPPVQSQFTCGLLPHQDYSI